MSSSRRPICRPKNWRRDSFGPRNIVRRHARSSEECSGRLGRIGLQLWGSISRCISAGQNRSEPAGLAPKGDLSSQGHGSAGSIPGSRNTGWGHLSSSGGESMAVRIVQLGSPRATGEGLRIGTVRRPPRGVPKSEFASRNYYDVWLPNLAPSDQLVKAAQSAKNEADWRSFIKRYRSEMSRPENSRILDLLAALSHQTNFSVGCYCNDEQHCHRSVLRQLLAERGASIA